MKLQYVPLVAWYFFYLCATAKAFTEEACEGGTIRAWCSSSRDEWLRIDDAFWGRASTTQCAGPNANSTTCISPDFVEHVRRVCEGRKDCKISALWRSLGDPCPGISKYANVTYRCQACSNSLSNSDCEAKKEAGECESNRVAMMNSCFRTCSRCSEFNAATCDNTEGGESFATTNTLCDYWAFGGECYKNPWYMLPNCEESCKSCAAKSQRTAESCEGEYVYMQCDTPYFLNVDEVKYGRFDTSFCPHDTVTSDSLCPTSTVALERVRSACEGRRNCSMHVTNLALDPSDPCPNISKQASVRFTCQLCENKRPNGECAQRARNLECTFNRNEMMEDCFAECSGCKDAECRNDEGDDRACDFWSMQGECTNNPNFMYYKCSRSCRTCNCKNIEGDVKCNAWARSGQCTANPGWMPYNCAKACGTCFDCINTYGNDNQCKYWASIGECAANPFWMMYKCAHACYACGDKIGKFSHKVCEGVTRRLHCDNAEQMIRLTEVFYGRRNNDTCPHASYTSGLDCAASQNMLSRVTDYCNGRSDCVIRAINGLFGDPCEGVTKQLEVEYFCQDCYNKIGDAECETKKNNGDCESDAENMLDNCFKACTDCRTTECENVDSDTDCDYWAMIGECTANPDYMLARCKKSCDQDCANA